jgi:iron complex transport system permease protein
MKKSINAALFFIILILSFFLLIIFLSTIGSVKITFTEAFNVLLGKIQTTNEKLYFNLRLPRVLLALIIGAGLALSGEGLQLTLKNPLADPYIIGISAGASFGAVLSLVIKQASKISINMELSAFVFSLISTFLVYFIAKRGGKTSVTSLILSGVIISFLFNAMVTLLVTFAWKNILTIHFWALGSLASAKWSDIFKILPAVIGEFIIFAVLKRKMLILSSGEEHATSLGINPERLKVIIFFTVSFVCSLMVSSAGIIGFVGLIIPHTVRLVVRIDKKIELPIVAITGGTFLIICDTIARTAARPAEIPLGAITALVGAPFFIILLKRRDVSGYE